MVLLILEYCFISNLFLKDLFGRKMVCLFDKKVIVYWVIMLDS